jgi:tetratricopeptide (TPR) repeat protein
MAARGSGGLFLCVALLLAMPALAATPADRDQCAASADKPDVGGAACRRIINDASEQTAERVEAFKNRGRGFFNRQDYDRAIADYSEVVKISPKDPWAFAHRCEAYEGKEDHDAAASATKPKKAMKQTMRANILSSQGRLSWRPLHFRHPGLSAELSDPAQKDDGSAENRQEVK